MRLLLVSAALWAAMGSVSFAQSVADIGGPRELPPPSYKGQQYVDSRGCVFLRAGLAGRTNWVPRVSRDRKVLCGYPPTFGPKPVIEMADEAPARAAPETRVATAPAPAAQPAPKAAAPRVVAQAKPSPADAPTVVSADKADKAEKAAPRATATARKTVVAQAAPSPADAPTVLPGPRAATAKAPQAAAPRVAVRQAAAPSPADEPTVVSRAAASEARKAAPERNPSGYQVVSGDGAGRRIGCFSNAPVPQRVRTADGGSVVVCTAGDGSLDGWRSPIYPDGGVGSALSDHGVVARADHAAAHPAAPGPVEVADAVPTPPKGYKLAWQDDRLNPNRGKGTAEGQAAQDRIWTRDVPAQLQIEEALRKGKKVVIVRRTPAGGVSVSAKGETTPKAKTKTREAAAGALVQVGTFGVPANAEAAAARLSALGLPVSRARITKSGKPLTIVMAGPFSSGAEAQKALSAARGAGFGDAFLR